MVFTNLGSAEPVEQAVSLFVLGWNQLAVDSTAGPRYAKGAKAKRKLQFRQKVQVVCNFNLCYNRSRCSNHYTEF